MPFKIVTLPVMAALGIFFIAAGPAVAQQPAGPGDIGNATVTLYYYDSVNDTKGAIVNMTDNPQRVNWDPALAAPGMYTFAHVPSGRWYYLEADHNGNKWYAIFYMGENVGTKTANVAIPPLKPVDTSGEKTATPSPTPGQATVMPAASTPAPTISEGPHRPTPGMTPILTILAAALALFIALRRR